MNAHVSYRRETELSALPVLRLLPWLALGWLLAHGAGRLLPDLPDWPLVFGPLVCAIGWLLAGSVAGQAVVPLALACVLAVPQAQKEGLWHEPRSGAVLQCIGQEPGFRGQWNVTWRLWLPDALGRCRPEGRVLQRADSPQLVAAGDLRMLPPRGGGGKPRLQCRPR